MFLLTLPSVPSLLAEDTYVRILTDVPGAYGFVDNQPPVKLDNSTFRSTSEHYDAYGDGGFGAYVNAGNVGVHTVTVVVNTLRSNQSRQRQIATTADGATTTFLSLRPAVVAPPVTAVAPPAVTVVANRLPAGNTFGTELQTPFWRKAFGDVPSLLLVGTITVVVVIVLGEIAIARRSSRHLPIPTIVAMEWPAAMAEQCRWLRPVRRIGRGGVASVYLATEGLLRRPMAVKVMHQSHTDSSILRARFLQEAVVLRRLAGTGAVPRVLGVSNEEFPRPWIAMTYLHNMLTLRLMIGGERRKRLPRDWAARLAVGLCERVQAIHDQGVVHRDVSPENVLYGENDDRQIRIIDFDCARTGTTSLSRSELSEQAEGTGKYRYTAPEQWQEFDAATAASDAYSVGVIIWEMFLGYTPFEAQTPDETRRLHREGVRDAAPLVVEAGVPAATAGRIVGLLAVDPRRRPSLREVAESIRETMLHAG
jgi:tRNA A-37 threonylcarbamoyl transferase component Bud32